MSLKDLQMELYTPAQATFETRNPEAAFSCVSRPDAPDIVFEDSFRYIRHMILSLIVAASDNDVIGKDNWMPWDLPAEIAYFRAVTRGKPVIMGRKTFDSVGRPMPGRHNVVVTRDPALRIEGADTAQSIEDAIETVKGDEPEEVFVIGGEQIYKLAMPYADRIYLTRVHKTYEGGEAFFPQFDESAWNLVESQRHEADEQNKIPYTTMLYERRPVSPRA